MTSREEIERLLNQTGRTLEGLPEHHNDAEIHNRIKELIGTWGLYAGMPELGEHILHQSDVIEVLVEALKVALAKIPKWISAEERLPKNDDLAPVQANGRARETRWEGAYVLAMYGSEGWVLWDYEDDEVQHLKILRWMPLPEPSKENSDEQ